MNLVVIICTFVRSHWYILCFPSIRVLVVEEVFFEMYSKSVKKIVFVYLICFVGGVNGVRKIFQVFISGMISGVGFIRFVTLF